MFVGLAIILPSSSIKKLLKGRKQSGKVPVGVGCRI
jgi:hypothetical protein